MKPIPLLVLLTLTSSCLRRPRYVYHPPTDTPTVATPPHATAQDRRATAPRVSDNPADWPQGRPAEHALWRPLHRPASLSSPVVYRTEPSPWWVYAAVAAAGIILGVSAHRYLPGLIMRLRLS